MYVAVVQFDFQASILLFLLCAAAAVTVGRLATRPTHRRLRATARVGLVLLLIVELLVLVRVGLAATLAGYGWQFVADRVLLTLLLVAVPAVAVLIWTLPRLWSLARGPAPGRDAPVPEGALRVARSVGLALPVQATLIGGLGGLFKIFLPPYRSPLGNLVVYGAVLGVATVLLWWRRRRRMRRLAAIGQARWSLRRAALTGATAVVVAVTGVALFITTMRATALPGTYDMMQGVADYGGGPQFEHAHGGGTSVTELTGPRDREPDRRFTLTAQEKSVRLSSGRQIRILTFNGQAPGPELRMREGELVEVTLTNKLADIPVTIHWHGMDVPNAEDGVAGVTQNAVAPGRSHTYRFVADEVGTRWYHSHQQASETVRRGLFGPLIIEPRTQTRPVDHDITAAFHVWDTPQGGQISTFGGSDTLQQRQVAAGDRVRLRLINTDNQEHTFTLTGSPYRITAWDGTDVVEPTDLKGHRLPLGGAGRYDLEFTMPDTPVRLVEVANPQAGILLTPGRSGELAADLDGPEFDPTRYGSPQRTPFGPESDFDRDFELVFDDWLGFYNGQFVLRQTVNGRVFPYAPMHLVREGDLVRMRFVNRGEENHPIHLHGHHMLVLSRNGAPVKGSPVWLDTVNVRSGEVWEVAFQADNPGVWMDHCHNLDHTRLGMVLHLAYEGVTTPFVIGGGAHNHPE